MCFRGPARCNTSIQCAIGLPYVFSIDGKYDAGPVTFGVSDTGQGETGENAHSEKCSGDRIGIGLPPL